MSVAAGDVVRLAWLRHSARLHLDAARSGLCRNKKAAENLVATLRPIAGPFSGLHRIPGAVPPDMCLEVVTKLSPSMYSQLFGKFMNSASVPVAIQQFLTVKFDVKCDQPVTLDVNLFRPTAPPVGEAPATYEVVDVDNDDDDDDDDGGDDGAMQKPPAIQVMEHMEQPQAANILAMQTHNTHAMATRQLSPFSIQYLEQQAMFQMQKAKWQRLEHDKQLLPQPPKQLAPQPVYPPRQGQAKWRQTDAGSYPDWWGAQQKSTHYRHCLMSRLGKVWRDEYPTTPPASSNLPNGEPAASSCLPNGEPA